MLDLSGGGGVLTWTMRFDPVNAIDPEFLSAMESALDAAIGDESVAVVVIASGLEVFSAGAAANWIGQVARERGLAGLLTEFNHTMDRFRDFCVRMRKSDLLFIAALNGHTLAGGLELAAACDLRFAADDARIRIGAPEMKLFGVMPSGGGGAQFIARLIGPGRALEFILGAEACSPSRASELGLVERLYPPADLTPQTEAFARRVAARAGRIGINAAKRSIADAVSLPVYEGLEVDRIVHWDSMRRGGFLPGVEAFIEKYG